MEELAGELVVLGPAKAGFRRDRIHRAARHPGGYRGIVVARRRDVVRGVGVKQRGQVLDLAAAALLLALAAAVDRDPVRLAVLVDLEQLTQRAEPRRLGVDGLP